MIPRTTLAALAALAITSTGRALGSPGVETYEALETYLKASNTGAADGFGWKVAVSGDTLAIGAVGESSSATGVGGDESDNGAGSAGAVYVFVRVGSAWSQQAYLKASNAEAGDAFGAALGLSGDTLVVGAPGESSSATGTGGDEADNSATAAGAVYVFERSGTAWSQQAYVKASNSGAGDAFGTAVGVSGDVLVVGSPEEDSSATGVDGDGSDNGEAGSGAAYVFVRNGATWIEEAYLKASNSEGSTGQYCIPGPFPFCVDEASDRFGLSVAVSGEAVMIGAPGEDSSSSGVNGVQSSNGARNSGAAYVFRRSGSTWSQEAYIKASNPGGEVQDPTDIVFPGDGFGTSVAVWGDTAVVGSPGEGSLAAGVNGDQTNPYFNSLGAAYLFVRTGADWAQDAYLKASNPGLDDEFGSSVSIAEGLVVVGALGEGSSATGVHGDQDDNSAPFAGAAYVFAGAPGHWSQRGYLKATNTELGDGFAFCVAAGGDTIAVGASQEDSSATGVNGDAGDNSATSSGAVYVFEENKCGDSVSSTETVRLGSPPNANAFLAGQTSPPVIGTTWDPAIDHASFALGAIADFMIVSGGPANLPIGVGTLLCDPTQPPFLLLGNGGPPGAPFQVAIPDNCGLVGAEICAQGGSVLPDSTTPLANALDLVIGTF